MRAFGVSGCAGWIWPRFDAPRSARARSRDAPGRAPSAGIKPLGSRLAQGTKPTSNSIVWRLRRQPQRRRRLQRIRIDGYDGGPYGFEPRTAEIDRSHAASHGTSASVEMPPSSTHTAPGRRRTHERCVPRFGRRYERRLAMCGAMRASPNKS